MKGEKSEKSKKSGVRVSNGDNVCDQKLGVLSIEPYGIPCALGLKKKLLETAAQPRIIGSENRRTVTTVGFKHTTLKSDPCPGEHITSSSADERALPGVCMVFRRHAQGHLQCDRRSCPNIRRH